MKTENNAIERSFLKLKLIKSYLRSTMLLDENRWYNFDDSHISLISEDEFNIRQQ